MNREKEDDVEVNMIEVYDMHVRQYHNEAHHYVQLIAAKKINFKAKLELHKQAFWSFHSYLSETSQDSSLASP